MGREISFALHRRKKTKKFLVRVADVILIRVPSVDINTQCCLIDLCSFSSYRHGGVTKLSFRCSF